MNPTPLWEWQLCCFLFRFRDFEWKRRCLLLCCNRISNFQSYRKVFRALDRCDLSNVVNREPNRFSCYRSPWNWCHSVQFLTRSSVIGSWLIAEVIMFYSIEILIQVSSEPQPSFWFRRAVGLPESFSDDRFSRNDLQCYFSDELNFCRFLVDCKALDSSKWHFLAMFWKTSLSWLHLWESLRAAHISRIMSI